MKQVPGQVALDKVGATRHTTEHRAKAVSAEKQVYILHSKECVSDFQDRLVDCPWSMALMRLGIEEEDWPMDTAVTVEVVDGLLTPVGVVPDEDLT